MISTTFQDNSIQDISKPLLEKRIEKIFSRFNRQNYRCELHFFSEVDQPAVKVLIQNDGFFFCAMKVVGSTTRELLSKLSSRLERRLSKKITSTYHSIDIERAKVRHISDFAG